MTKKPGRKSKEEEDRELDEGLKETFPASDPPAVIQPDHREPQDKTP